jgi:ABC-type uncharacterized transport system substrate-binding protein
MIKRRAQYLFLCLLPLATPVGAHPHVFVDVALRFAAGPGGVAGVEVTWTYDEFYSLLLFEDMKLDNDADGRLSPAEEARLQGFDLNWDPGFKGDLEAYVAGAEVALGRPEPRSTRVIDGRIETTHFRALTAPGAKVDFKAYDPTFYVAYELAGRVTVSDGCAVEVTPADLDRAYTLVEEALYKDPPKDDDSYPEVGAAFADLVEVTCKP